MPQFERGEGEGPVIRAIGASGFTVGAESYAAVLLTPERAEAWDAPALDELKAEALAPLLALDPPPEFILIGTGAAMAFPPRPLVAALEERGIGVEAMDSRAAARAWALLRAEGRWIAAALMPLG